MLAVVNILEGIFQKKISFIYLRARVSMGGVGEGEGEGEADSPLSRDPKAGLDPRTRELKADA